jgi:hypothetical protein
MKFNKLSSDEIPDGLSPGSHRMVVWSCECGRKVVRAYRDVVSGRSKSCGRCDWFTKHEMSTRVFGALRVKTPEEIAPRSNRRIVWVCSCGREIVASMADVASGHTKSCGKCGLFGRTVEIPAQDIAERKFGKLRIKHAESVVPGSHRKVVWVCDCGREKAIDINSVVSGKSKSCGHCNDISAAEMSVRKFGRLRIKYPVDTPPGSRRKVEWICDCGVEIRASIAHVVSGHTSSCGRCNVAIRSGYASGKYDIRKLRTPIEPSQLPNWCPIALETIKKVSEPFRARCRLCGKEYFPRWDGIRVGKSLTCGCTVGRVSSGQKDLADFIVSLGLEVVLEHSIGGMKYDVFVPSANLVVEFAGLRWHSMPDSLKRDLAKRRNAFSRGLKHIMVFEDEWLFKRFQIENLLRNAVGKSSPVSIRPLECELRRIEARQADPFYEKFHYIGGCKSSVNYGVFFEQQLVACCSFKKPTRQSKYDWELVRMASDPGLRVHGIWSKILKRFISEFNPKSIVSFSDNRLFDGGVYSRIGFLLDGDVKPSRYWWKGKRRFHQSAMRKPRGETRTETELRRSQGFNEIWDLGKKRWVFSVHS